MKRYIYENWKNYYSEIGRSSAPFEIEDIVIDDECINDDRCGWHDTRYVCVKRMGNEINDTPQCIGMCAADYEKALGANA